VTRTLREILLQVSCHPWRRRNAPRGGVGERPIAAAPFVRARAFCSTLGFESRKFGAFGRSLTVLDLPKVWPVARALFERTFLSMSPRAWSLADELTILAHAVEATRRLANDASQNSDATRDLTAMAAALSGSLALLGVRLRDLGRVVRGELDPRLLRAPHNAVELEAAGNADDVIFRAWGRKRRAAEARRELARVERERARRRR
jgi:hypothetical protein